MAKRRCGLCSYVYDDSTEDIKWEDLPDDWVCPVCGSPKSSFTLLKEDSEQPSAGPAGQAPIIKPNFLLYECSLCSFVYDEEKEEIRWDDLPGDWNCPVCGSGKSSFRKLAAPPEKTAEKPLKRTVDGEYLAEWNRPSDEFEKHMTDIHRISVEGRTVIDPMRSRVRSFEWDEILFKGAQLSRLPLNKSQPVSLRTVIGPAAAHPLVIENPVYISHMSFGALSKEAKIALSRGSAAAGTAMCSGEGGILPDSLFSAYKYIFEYVPNKYSLTDDYLGRVDAVEIKIGQSAKPGMGGHLPGDKVTREIAEIRGFREGQDIISPSSFPDIRNREDLRNTVDGLRKRTGGKPIGIKIAACHLEEDMEAALHAGPDFITIDGNAGGTGAAPKVIKSSASIPSIFALARARRFLDSQAADNVSLVITGGLRITSDFAKALAMGADAVAVATSAMMAVGCQQYRICNTGRCPVGIATQDPALRARLDVEMSAERVANFFRVTADELKDFARMTGNSDIHKLAVDDICTVNSEISNNTDIQHV